MWECSSPYPVGFLRFDSVGETLQADWAARTDRFRGSRGVVAGLLVGVVLGEEYGGHFLTGCATVLRDSVEELFGKGLSAVAHKMILLEVYGE